MERKTDALLVLKRCQVIHFLLTTTKHAGPDGVNQDHDSKEQRQQSS